MYTGNSLIKKFTKCIILNGNCLKLVRITCRIDILIEKKNNCEKLYKYRNLHVDTISIVSLCIERCHTIYLYILSFSDQTVYIVIMIQCPLCLIIYYMASVKCFNNHESNFGMGPIKRYCT